MGHDTTRREFLKTASLFSLGVLIIPSALATTHFSHEERILLGIEKPDDLTSGAFRLRSEAGESFVAMQKAALNEGVEIYSQSSYRSFNRQLGIWERKYDKYTSQRMKGKDACNKIIKYSTVPGTSRHHWGTDVDIIDAKHRLPSNPLSESHFKKGGVYYKLYDWMRFNAHNYGFYEVYTNNEMRTGFEYEPWHWSYKKQSQPMLEQFMKIDLVEFYEKSKMKGHEYLSKDFLKKYIKENLLDINTVLLPKSID